MTNRLMVFGADWCPNCAPFKEQLESLNIEFEYFDVDEESAKELAQRNGIARIPTALVKSPEGETLLNESGSKCIEQIKKLMLD